MAIGVAPGIHHLGSRIQLYRFFLKKNPGTVYVVGRFLPDPASQPYLVPMYLVHCWAVRQAFFLAGAARIYYGENVLL